MPRPFGSMGRKGSDSAAPACSPPLSPRQGIAEPALGHTNPHGTLTRRQTEPGDELQPKRRRGNSAQGPWRPRSRRTSSISPGIFLSPCASQRPTSSSALGVVGQVQAQVRAKGFLRRSNHKRGVQGSEAGGCRVLRLHGARGELGGTAQHSWSRQRQPAVSSPTD